MPIQLFYYDFNLPGQCYSMLKNMHTQPFSIRFPVATSLQLEYHININNSKLVKLIYYNNNKNLIVFYNIIGNCLYFILFIMHFFFYNYSLCNNNYIYIYIYIYARVLFFFKI